MWWEVGHMGQTSPPKRNQNPNPNQTQGWTATLEPFPDKEGKRCSP